MFWMAEVVELSRTAPSPVRVMLWMVLLAFLIGPVATALGKLVEHGEAPLAVFSLLMLLVIPVLRVVGKRAEALVFSVEHGPWLGGRLKRWQRLILPFDTATVFTTSISAGMAGGCYLLVAPPQWSALNVGALGFVGFGGLLMGFGLSRLVVGAVIPPPLGPLGAVAAGLDDRRRCCGPGLGGACGLLDPHDLEDRPGAVGDAGFGGSPPPEVFEEATRPLSAAASR